MAQLAQTNARLSTSISIYAINGTLDPNNPTNPNSAVLVGAVLSLSETNPRGTTPRYELDANKAGEMVERTPGLADNMLTLNRVVLYASDMLEAFGFSDAQSIIDQNVPFIIVKEERAPASSGVQTRTTVYEGCWFHDLPKNYDITGDLRVIQNVEVGYTKKTRV